ncbi:hypothetical protein CF327_g7389, partial [Tilletia walkeri]
WTLRLDLNLNLKNRSSKEG